jgi:hypothetical protein
MEWNDLKTNPPTGNEYAVILFPCKSDCGILYTASNPHYAIKNGVSSGYTHWAEIQLAPDHDKWQDWQDSLTYEEIEESLQNSISTLKNLDVDTSSKEYTEWMSNVWKMNDKRNKALVNKNLD